MMSYFYKLILQYNGCRYMGWQIQPDQMTVQGELNKALFKIANSMDVKSIGSGRTDKGVHALGQVVRVEISQSIPTEGLKKALNSLLPEDIRVVSVFVSDKDFHPVFNAKEKQYDYIFSSNTLGVFLNKQVSFYKYDEIEFDRMSEVLDLFKGSHDFINYMCKGTEVKSTVRKIIDISISKEQVLLFPGTDKVDICRVSIVGTGFLKQMVRLIIGAVWSYGRGRITKSDIIRSLQGNLLKDRLGAVAPAEGLYLVKVIY